MLSVFASRLYAAGIPPIAPDANAIPGTSQALTIVGGLMFWGLLACVVALIGGAATWYGGSKGQNVGIASGGRSAVIGAIGGAIVLGAGVAVLNWGLGVGQTVTA